MVSFIWQEPTMVRIETTTYDHAVEQLHQTGTTQARKRIWDFINSQQTLYFVQCGSGSSAVPWIMFEGDEPMAMVFTSLERAKQAATSCIEQKHEIRVVGLPTDAASMYINAIAAQGVPMVCFNHGPQRFDAAMDEVLIAVGSLTRH